MNVDPDLIFILGVVVAIISLPTLLAAWTHGESPRRGAVLFILAAGLILTAATMRPGEYTVARAHQLVGSVIGNVLN